jgi:hypothetical protein
LLRQNPRIRIPRFGGNKSGEGRRAMLPYPDSGPSFTRESASPFLFLSKRTIRIRVVCLSSSIYSCISLFWSVWWQCLSTYFGSAWRGALGLSGSLLPHPESGPSFTRESASKHPQDANCEKRSDFEKTRKKDCFSVSIGTKVEKHILAD